jgi:hypothetical protein
MAIKRKLILITVISSSVALLAACIAFAAYETFNFRTATRAKLATMAAMIGANTAVALSFDDDEAAGETLSALGEELQVLAGCLYDQWGALFPAIERGIRISSASWSSDLRSTAPSGVACCMLTTPSSSTGSRSGPSSCTRT